MRDLHLYDPKPSQDLVGGQMIHLLWKIFSSQIQSNSMLLTQHKVVLKHSSSVSASLQSQAT